MKEKELTIKINKQSLIGFSVGVILTAGIFSAVLGVRNIIPIDEGAAPIIKTNTGKGEVQTNPSTEGSQKVVFAITESDHVRGNFNAPVTIVEFSDFQCPYCQKFHPTVQQIIDAYPGKVRWVYKHFPLGFHAQAQPAAEASECAAEQEKFWEFSDGLFENQSRLGEALYGELASELGLDMDQFENCVAARKYKSRVEANLLEGQKAGVRGTPGSFINGVSVPGGAVPYATLKALVEQTLSK